MLNAHFVSRLWNAQQCSVHPVFSVSRHSHNSASSLIIQHFLVLGSYQPQLLRLGSPQLVHSFSSLYCSVHTFDGISNSSLLFLSCQFHSTQLIPYLLTSSLHVANVPINRLCSSYKYSATCLMFLLRAGALSVSAY